MKKALSVNSALNHFRLVVIGLAFIAESLLIAISPVYASTSLETLELTPHYNEVREPVVLSGATDASALSKELAVFLKSAFTSPAQNVSPLAKSLSAYTPATTPEVDSITYSKQGTPRRLKTNFKSSLAQAKSMSGDALLQTLANEFLEEFASLTRIKDPRNELSLIRIHNDTMGRHYLRYQQMYQGLPVWPAELTVQINAQHEVDLLNGHYIATPEHIPLEPVIQQSSAEGIALDAHSNTSIETSQLVIHAPTGHIPRLAWKIKLAPTLTSSWLVFIDAIHGGVLKQINQVKYEQAVGSGVDTLGETRSLDLWESTPGTFYMIDTSKPMYITNSIQTSPPDRDEIQGAIIIEDANNAANTNALPPLSIVSSANASVWSDPDAVSAAYTLSEAYDYFALRHNHENLVPANESLKAIINFGAEGSFNNAFWQPDLRILVFGDGDNYVASLDIVAHELSHALIDDTARLIYENQSGALNEAFADIFGEAAEARTFGVNDWLLGSALDTPSRNLADPGSINIPGTSRPYPSTMSQYVYPDDPILDTFGRTRDYGGVHINSTIISHAFYLLANSIGIINAERIFYHTLNTQLTSYSQFIDARLGAISSAEILFGANSSQALATANAFTSVGILDSDPTPPPTTTPQVPSSDSTVYIDYGNQLRYKEGDAAPADHPVITSNPKASIRPSIVGNGEYVLFVKDNSPGDDQLCLYEMATDSDTCYTPAGASINSIAIAPLFIDPETTAPTTIKFAYTIDTPEINEIVVVDIENLNDINTRFSEHTITVSAPTTAPPTPDDGDAVNLSTIIKIGDLDFSKDSKHIYFNALNRLTHASGTTENWSIYSASVANIAAEERIRSVIPPIRGMDFKQPSLGKTSDHYLTFTGQGKDPNTGASISVLYAADLTLGLAKQITFFNTMVDLYPSYNGNDSAIIYAYGGDLMRQNLSTDHISKADSPTTWLADAQFGVVYRRGDYHGPNTAPDGTIDKLERDDTLLDHENNIYDIDINDTITFTGSAIDAEGDTEISYTWRVYDLDDRFIGEAFGAQSEITFPKRGAFIVKLIASDQFGAADPTPARITVRVSTDNILPESTITSPATSEVTIPVGQILQFNGTGFDADATDKENPALSYFWDFDGVQPISSTEKEPPPVQFDTPGRYTITFTVTDEEGAADDVPAKVFVHVVATADASTSEPLMNDVKPSSGGGGGALNILFLLLAVLGLTFRRYAK